MVTSGHRDIVALAIGVSGLLFVGPLELFFPQAAYGALGGTVVWTMLIAFFTLTLLLITMIVRPRVVVYGSTIDQLRDPLLRAAKSLDPDARIDGDQVWLPKFDTGLRLDVMSPTDTPQILPTAVIVSPRFWQQIRKAIRTEVSTLENTAADKGILLLLIGLLMIAIVGLQMYLQPGEIVAGFRSMLRLQ